MREPLTKDSSVTIENRNIRALAIEMYKVRHRVSASLLNEVFVHVTYKIVLKTHLLSKIFRFLYRSFVSIIKI